MPPRRRGERRAIGPSGGMADALDLKSSGGQPPCGFDSRLGYLFFSDLNRTPMSRRLVANAASVIAATLRTFGSGTVLAAAALDVMPMLRCQISKSAPSTT